MAGPCENCKASVLCRGASNFLRHQQDTNNTLAATEEAAKPLRKFMAYCVEHDFIPDPGDIELATADRDRIAGLRRQIVLTPEEIDPRLDFVDKMGKVIEALRELGLCAPGICNAERYGDQAMQVAVSGESRQES